MVVLVGVGADNFDAASNCCCDDGRSSGKDLGCCCGLGLPGLLGR